MVEWRGTDGADWYDLYYAPGADPTTVSPAINDIGGGASTQLVTGLENGQEYCFGVIANGCSFGQILCDTPESGGSCQQDCGEFALEQCSGDTSGKCFYYTFMQCVADDYEEETRVARHEDGHEEGCGNNTCEINYCLEVSSCNQYLGEGISDYDAWTSCMVSCVENNEAASYCTAPEITLWPSGDDEPLACGDTVTDGSVDDLDGRVDGCIDIDLNWTTDVLDIYEFRLWGTGTGGWSQGSWLSGSSTSRKPFRVCEAQANHCDGLPCTFTDTYQISVYQDTGPSATSNECAVTFNFPDPCTPFTVLPDDNLQECMAGYISDNGWSCAEEVTGTLECDDWDVADLTNIADYPNLTGLSIWYHSVTDLSPLIGLPLAYLDLSVGYSNLVDISVLSSLPLTWVYLSYNSGISCADMDALRTTVEGGGGTFAPTTSIPEPLPGANCTSP